MVQEDYFEKWRSQKTSVSIFLISGIQLVGTITDFDRYTIILRANDGKCQLIYKRVIATCQPHNAEQKNHHRRNRLFR